MHPIALPPPPADKLLGVRTGHVDTRVSVSCSPCSSELSAKARTQKELFKTLKELKMQQPAEKRSKGKPSTVNALKYALRCVKQVKGETKQLSSASLWFTL